MAEANQLVEPIFEYDRDFGVAIIGTVINRDARTSYLGESLVIGDFTGRLYYGDLETSEEFEFQFTDDSAALPRQIHSVNFAANGEIRVLGIRSNADAPSGFEGVVVGIEPCFGAQMPGDFNEDGVVGFEDFLILSENYTTSNRSHEDGDTNCDSLVEFRDFLVVSESFGATQRQFVQQQPVPEPTARYHFFWVGVLGLCWFKNRRSDS